MVHPAPHTKAGGPHPCVRAHSRDTLGPSTPGPGRPDSAGLTSGGFPARAKVLLPGGPSGEQLAAQSQTMLILLDHRGGAALDGGELSFDQCRLGQLVKKATTLATDLPIQDWDQMRCTHHSHVGTNESSTLSRYPWDMMAGLAKAIAVSLTALGHIRIPSEFPENPKEPPKGRGSDPPDGPSPRPNQGGGPSSSHQGSKPGGKSAPKPRLHGQIHLEADTVSPRGAMNPDFPSPMPPMAGDAEQLGKEGLGDQVLAPRMPARFQGPTPH